MVTLWYTSLSSPGIQMLGNNYVWQRLWTSGLSPIVECVLGVVLFFRSRGLANLWHRLQSARYVKIDDAGLPAPTDQKKE